MRKKRSVLSTLNLDALHPVSMVLSMPASQKLSVLQRRLAEIGIRPDARHGQNFLIDMNLLELLVREAKLTPNDVVLEVGTGTGAVTELIADQAGAVVSVEIDQHLFGLATELLFERNHVRLLHQDALKNKNRFDPRVIEAVQQALAEAPGRQLKLVANLPYCVATPVLSNLLSCEVLPVTMTATIQKELADRIVASPATKDYGALSIWIQSQCDARLVRLLPPSVFWPRPKVDSAIIQITVNPAKRDRIPNRRFFHQFVRAMFIHRRKVLRSNLLGALKRHAGKPEVDALMQPLGLAPQVRAEELSVEQMLSLAEAACQLAPDWKL